MGAPWPRRAADAGRIALSGLLVHGVYLGGVFTAIHLGMSAGLAALIVGLQPILTAVVAGPMLGERMTPVQWLGLVLGLVGVALVVSGKATLQGMDPWAPAYAIGALLGITLGTLYQKRHGGAMDLRTGSAIQFGATALLMAVAAGLFETRQVAWTPSFLFALGWLIVVLSLGAITLLYLMIRRGAASRVASLFYLVPPVTALIAYFLFDEKLDPPALAGMAVAVVGVALVLRKK